MSPTAPVPDPGSPAEGFHRADGEGPFAINDASRMAPRDASWRAMVAMMRADAQAFRERWQEPLLRRAYPGLLIAWSHRLSHTLHLRGLRALAMVVMWACHALTGAEIRPGALVGPGLTVVHPSGIVVGGGTVLGARVQLYGGCHFGSRLHQGIHGSPHVGDDVVVGAHAVVVGPIRVGDGAEIGAGAVVVTDVAAGARVKGPAAG